MPSPKAEGRDTDVLTATQAQTRVVELESDLMRLEAELRDARHTIDRLERSGGSPPDRKRKASISGSTVASAMASPSANGTTPPTPVLDDLLPSYATTPVTAASPSPTPSKAALFFTGPVDSEVFARFVRRVVTLYEPTSSADAAQQRWAGKELEGLLHYVRVHNLTYPAVSDLCHESSCDEGFARTPMHADAHRYSAPPGASSSHTTAALQTRPTAFRSASSSPHQRRTANHATPRRVKQHHSHHSHHSHPSHNNQQHRTASPPLVFRSSSPVSQQRTVSPPVARRVVGPAVATAISRMVPMDGPAPSYGDATRASQSPSSSPAPAAPAAAASGDHAAPTRTVSPQSVRRRSGTQPFPAHLGKRPSSGSYSRNSSKSLSGAPPPPQRPPPPSPRRGESKSFSAAGVPVRSRSRSTSPEKRQAERQLQHLQAQQEELEGHAPAVATLAAKARVVSVSVPELLIREDQEREKACRDRAARIRWPQTQGMPAQS